MPLKPHPTDPDKMVYASRQYDIPQLQGVTTAQPEQEPVAWGVDWGKTGDIPCVSIIKRLPNGGIKVMAVEYAPYSYTASPQRPWVGLTNDEIEDLFQSAAGADEETHIRFARAIENALRSKNT